MDIVIPNLAESVTEGDLAKWLKQDGEQVQKDELILELETDKASVELAAEANGTLEILVEAGQTVHVGDVVGRIVENGEEAEEQPAEKKEPEEEAEPEEAEREKEEAGKTEKKKEEAERAEKEEEEEAEEPEKPEKPEERERKPPEEPEPLEERVDHRTVREGERKEKPAAKEKPVRPEAKETPPREEEPGTRREKMTRLRRRIAERLVEAQRTAAILTTFNEIDMSGIMALRQEHQPEFEERHGVRLGFMSLFARASILALRDFPQINAFIEGDEIVYHDPVHLGIAVGTPRGLVVPVLRHAERMSFAEIERTIKELATRARDGDLTIDELQGGTFTISNGGIYGSLMSTPILNPPQSGILGMHKIEKRAVVLEDPDTGEERIVSRPMMYVALSYDHRIVDGEEAVSFLVTVKERLESPPRLLLDS